MLVQILDYPPTMRVQKVLLNYLDLSFAARSVHRKDVEWPWSQSDYPPKCCQGFVQKVLLNGLDHNLNYSTMSEVCAEKASKEEWLNEILNLTKNASILSAFIVQKMKCLWGNGLDPNLDNLNNTRSVRWKSLKRDDSLMKMWFNLMKECVWSYQVPIIAWRHQKCGKQKCCKEMASISSFTVQ